MSALLHDNRRSIYKGIMPRFEPEEIAVQSPVTHIGGLYLARMRSTLFTVALAAIMGIIPAAFARTPLPPINDQNPQNYDQVKTELDKIDPFLEEAMCGGTLDRTVEGTIARVTGVPGRNTVWNGAVLSGMGVRRDDNGNGNKDDDFTYPGSAVGLTTSCWQGTDRVSKVRWVKTGNSAIPADKPPEIAQEGVEFPHPKFEDPACRWRLKEDGAFSEEAPDVPLKPLSETTPTPEYGELTDVPQDRQSPPVCRNFCTYLNTYVYYDCLSPYVEIIPPLVEGDPPTPYIACGEWGFRFLCGHDSAPSYGMDLKDLENQTKDEGEKKDIIKAWFDQFMEENKADFCPAEVTFTGRVPVTVTEKKTNSKACTGDSCRCNDPDDFSQYPWCMKDANEPDPQNYRSYYRRYEGEYSRDKVEGLDAGDDHWANQAPVACYGFYQEFDPFHKLTVAQDRRCVIDMDVEDYREDQKGKGPYAEDLPDRDPKSPENQRNNGAYDAEKDLWYQKLTGGFSLLNETIFEKDFNNDLTNVFLNIDRLDNANQRATEQKNVREPLAKSNMIRAFDDTGTGRIVVTWWQKQQNEMAEAMHPPVIRLLVPAGWSFGADIDDPFLRDKVKVKEELFNQRNKRIELQIDADEDILGSAIGYMERSLLLDVREEPVPVLVPLGSPIEYLARAEQWCTWYMTQYGASDCNNAPADVRALIDRLEEYAYAIDNARKLRGELARYAGKVLDLQRKIVKPIGDWLEGNIDKYREVLEEQKNLRAQYTDRWRGVQETFDRFGGETNMPWCMNQRYTSPVYSLLDEWLPSRGLEGARISADLLPKITMPPAEDLIIDFSTISTVSGSILMPVLKPIQIRISDIPLPPSTKEYTLDRSFPELPSIDRVRDYIREAEENLPEAPEETPVPPPVDMKPLGGEAFAQLGNQISEIERIVNDMKDRYDMFWKSIGPLRPFGGDNTNPEDDPGNINGIASMKSKLECKSWDDKVCQHVEMDLIERFTRIGSRPLVMLNEDYLSVGPARSFGGPCIAADNVCTPMHPEGSLPKMQWEIIGPLRQPEFIDDVRTNVRNETLPAPIGNINRDNFPSYDTDINELLPAHDVQKPINLMPRSSSSAAAE